jgi:hypothetical protein
VIGLFPVNLLEWLVVFRRFMEENPDMATAVAAINTLIAFIEQSKGGALVLVPN